MGIIESCTSTRCCSKKNNEASDLSSSYDTSDNEDEETKYKEESESNEYKDFLNKMPKNLNDVKMNAANMIQSHSYSPWTKYVVISELGSGSFGTVNKIRLKDKRDTVRAMKVIPIDNINSEISKAKVLDEINILTTLDHPNIMKIYEFYEFENNIYIITEFCDNGNLLDKLIKLTYFNEIIVKFLMEQILNAVSYLHSRNILHGDLKLENVMLNTAVKSAKQRFTILSQELFKKPTLNRAFRSKNPNLSKEKKNEMEKFVESIIDYEIKLIDFGCSKIFTRKKTGKTRLESGIIGTSIYCSPEVIDDLYDERSDEWSCGVIMYILLSGEAPFKGETEDEIFAEVKKGKINFDLPEFERVSENCKDLIKKLLTTKKSHRITAAEALKHPFFTEDFKPMSALTHNKDLNILKGLTTIQKSKSKFYDTIVAYLCVNFIDKDEEQKLKKIFRYMDKKNSNILKKEDVNLCLSEVGFGLEQNQIDELLSIMDTDGSGTIEYQEFLSCLCNKEQLFSDENLKRVFEDIDYEHKGYINAKDIKEFAFKNQTISDEILNEYMIQFGMQPDEKLGYEKFKELVKG